MDIRIVFKNFDSSPEMEQHARQQLQKVLDFLANEPTPVFIDLVLEPSKTREHHHIKLIVKSPNYNLISEHHHDPNGMPFYKALDHIIDVMYLKLHDADKKRHEKVKTVGRHEEFKKQR